MEINITSYVNRADDMIYYSASPAEMGENAGQVTWANANDVVEEQPILKTYADVIAAVDYFLGYGAWDREEILENGSVGVNALMLQEIAASVREMKHYATEDEYIGACRRGEASSRCYQCNIENHKDFGQWFFSLDT